MYVLFYYRFCRNFVKFIQRRNHDESHCFGGQRHPGENELPSGTGPQLLCGGRGQKILFDTGFSDLFLKNAQILGIDLTDLDAIVFFHGHDDHMGGLYHLMEYYKARQVEEKADLILHPNALCPKCLNGKNMGNVLSPELLEGYFNIIPVSGSYALTPHLTFLGQIPRVLEFENTHSKVVTKLNGDWEEDKLLDDTSLVFDGEEGLVILSGWAHAGICNTVEAAKAITGKSKIQDIVGGFHLLHPTEERMDKTANYLSQLGLSHITPCHCTDFPSRCRIHQAVPVRPIGSGSVLEYR